ncbi:hypothetical protein K2F43_06015 [Clostridium estertheticum]|uniref:hypothetical protein n=1 Tax=Clostridium estertheticum TaxID=238834 RepID=UPI001C6E6972|nr:hypothetical protein [Clostridium estertheticum]MBW9170761.1 hypothetical protein [Clostridium estertheticum]WLC74400.1 hypothetical protein KTC99_16740 [Clostridium estertheticum]
MKNKLIGKQITYAVHIILKDGVTTYVYLGSGDWSRKSGNASKLKRNVHDNKMLQNAYNQEGSEMKFEILGVCVDKVEARGIENDYMRHFRMIDDIIVCNIYDAVTTKPYKKVLNESLVKEIKILLIEGKLSNNQIAKDYGVSPCQISKIKCGNEWKNVQV